MWLVGAERMGGAGSASAGTAALLRFSARAGRSLLAMAGESCTGSAGVVRLSAFALMGAGRSMFAAARTSGCTAPLSSAANPVVAVGVSPVGRGSALIGAATDVALTVTEGSGGGSATGWSAGGAAVATICCVANVPGFDAHHHPAARAPASRTTAAAANRWLPAGALSGSVAARTTGSIVGGFSAPASCAVSGSRPGSSGSRRRTSSIASRASSSTPASIATEARSRQRSTRRRRIRISKLCHCCVAVWDCSTEQSMQTPDSSADWSLSVVRTSLTSAIPARRPVRRLWRAVRPLWRRSRRCRRRPPRPGRASPRRRHKDGRPDAP